MEIEIFVAIVAPLATIMVAIISYSLNESAKRRTELYKRKEERYLILLKKLEGFYADTEDTNLKQDFLDELTLSWLYCPDDVIKKAYKFLDTTKSGKKHSEKEKNDALGAFVLALRKDLRNSIVSKTKLKKEDYQLLKAT